MPGVIGVGYRRTPKSHDRVANILIQRSTILLDNAGHRTQIGVHQLRQFLGVQPLRDTGKPADIRKQHGKLGVLAFHAVAFGIARHFVDEFGWHVLAKKLGKLALAARLDEIAPGHVQCIERENGRNNGSQRHHQTGSPQIEVETGCDQQHARGQQGGAQRGKYRQQQSQRQRVQRKLHDVRAKDIGWLLFNVCIEHAGDQIGMDLDARIGVADRRYPQIHQARRGCSEQNDLPGELFVLQATVQGIGRRQIVEATLWTTIRNQAGAVFVNRNTQHPFFRRATRDLSSVQNRGIR